MKMNRFENLIKKAKNIVITTHEYPDADGIGSEIALCMALKSLGKEAICVNEEPLMERYKYLDPKNVVTCFKEFKKKYIDQEKGWPIDLFIVTDTNNLKRIGIKTQQLAYQAKELLFIDHHPAPKAMEALHCIDTSVAATGELVGNLIESLGLSFNKELALPLYTSILIDTSCFRYPTVTSKTHRLISKLLDTGVEPPEAYNKIYGTKKISYIQFLGTVLSSSKSTEDGRIAWIKLKEKDLQKYQVDTEDTHGFVNHLLILDNIRVACMFRQIGRQVKISFRSAGDIDVGHMALALGGGGHNHSAATVVEGKIDQVIEEVIPKIKVMLEGEG